MALENELVCNWPDQGLTGTLNIPGNIEEFVEKESYTLKVTVTNTAGQTAIYEFEVTNALEHLPCLCVEGNYTGDGLDGWCYFPHEAFGVHAMNPRMKITNITSNIEFTLTSSSGSTAVYPVTIQSFGTADSIMISFAGDNEIDDASVAIQIEADFPLLMGTRDEYSNASVEVVRYVYDASEQGVIMSEIALAGDYSNIDQAINGFDVEDSIPQNLTYVIENRLKKNGSIVSTKIYRFQISPGSKIWLVAPQHGNDGQTYNMTLHISNTVANPFKYKGQNDADWTVSHLVTSPYQKYYYGTWTDYGTGDLYVTINQTNIPIFKDDTTGDAYRDGLIGEDQAENSGELERRDPTTGDDLESTDIPSVNVKSVGLGVNIWALSHSQIHQIMLKMFDDDQSIITDIQNGTWLWGNNPIDFVISCYWVPFDISNFYKLENERVMLGFYDTGFDYPQVKERGTVTQRISLVNTTIDPIYGDWRDKTFFKYEIYLPYVGFFPLDIMQYQNKKLTVELAFDVTTHNIRYYLFANNKLIDRVDGSVGLDIPLLATDMVNKAKSDLSGLTNILSGVGGMIEGGGKVAQGTAMSGQLPGGLGGENALVTQGTSGVFAGASQAITGVSQIFSYPRQMVVGEISSSMNIYDINYVYLKITQKDAIVPDKLNSLYNWPSYYMGPASVLSGYCELADIRFSSTATENEINEIIGLLKSGVIF